MTTFKTPLFPMRPCTGERLTPANILQVFAKYKKEGYIPQKKLNGDRGVLERNTQGLKLWNRCGTEYVATSVNLDGWRNLKPGTLLDGEIYQGEFYCFEEIIEGDTTFRIATGRATTMILGNKRWIFDITGTDWLLNEVRLDANPRTRMYEGIVWKLACAPYTPLKNQNQESPTVVKTKWS